MPATPAAIRTFFTTPSFAVLGAVPDTSRFGHKGSSLLTPPPPPLPHLTLIPLVFAWYHAHNLPVTGIHPRTPEIVVNATTYATIRSLNELPSDPSKTALSFITPPAATLATLRTAKEMGIPAVWFQPGAYNEECVAFAEEAGMTVVAGGPGEGACVLVHGEGGLEAAGRLGGGKL